MNTLTLATIEDIPVTILTATTPEEMGVGGLIIRDIKGFITGREINVETKTSVFGNKTWITRTALQPLTVNVELLSDDSNDVIDAYEQLLILFETYGSTGVTLELTRPGLLSGTITRSGVGIVTGVDDMMKGTLGAESILAFTLLIPDSPTDTARL